MFRKNYTKKKQSYRSKQCLFLLLAILLCSLFLPFINTSIAFADDTQTTYSTVLDDLSKDPNFNKEDYPHIDNDYSLSVIQIAESTNKELFVYVYQPLFYEFATSINISTSTETLKFKNYKLDFLSANATLYKYRVAGFVVADKKIRQYEISSIFRPFNTDWGDKAPSGDNTVEEVAFKVGKLFTACTIDGQVTYLCEETEVIEVVDKYVGFIRYTNGFNLYANSCDSHYIAFSTDRKIDTLLEADVSYIVRSAKWDSIGDKTTYGEPTEQYKTLYYDEKVSNSPGLFAEKRTWTRIEKASDFLKNENLLDDVKPQIKQKQFILRFYESDYKTGGTYIGSTLHKHSSFDEVTSVTILRLTFAKDGVTYNLGVVDNKQSGDINPDNHVSNWFIDLINRIIDWFKSLFEKLGTVLGTASIIAIIVAIVLLIMYFPPIIKFIGNLFKYLFIAIWYIIKYLAIGVYWIFAWPFYLKNNSGN